MLLLGSNSISIGSITKSISQKKKKKECPESESTTLDLVGLS